MEKELNLDLANLANQHAKEEYYKKSIQDGNMKTRIHGNTYVGKNNKNLYKVVVPVVGGLIIAMSLHAGTMIEEKDAYNRMMTEKLEDFGVNLSNENFIDSITSTVNLNNEIKATKTELDSSNYDIFGNNLVSNNEYTKDTGSLFTLSDKTLDAIDKITTEDSREIIGGMRK